MISDILIDNLFGDEVQSMRDRGHNLLASKRLLSYDLTPYNPEKTLYHLQGVVKRSKKPGTHSLWVRNTFPADVCLGMLRQRL